MENTKASVLRGAWSRRFLAAILAAALALPAPLLAQSTGTITGVVTDPQGAQLQGVEVRVDGTDLSASTDRTGRFRIDGVPAGNQRVTGSFLGLGEVSANVTVGTGVAAPVTLAYKESDTVTMDAYVVQSIAEGQARAINRQRASDTIKNIVAADALGRLPDANVAEALSRLPGIAVTKDLGEAEFITVRGTAAGQNAVSLNGDRLPSVGDPTESRDDRSVSLHSVPTDLISGIEVTKALTPDMDADALGANVNLLTKTSLEFNRRIFTGKLEGGYNDIRKSGLYAGNLTYGDRLPGGKVGYLFSASRYFSNRGLDSHTNDYGTRTPVGSATSVFAMTELQLRHRYLDRVREGYNGQIDFQTTEDSTHYIRGFYNHFEDREQRRRYRIGFGDNSRFLAGSSDSVGIVDGGRLRHEDRDSTKITDIYSVGAGGRWDRPGYLLDYAIGYTATYFKIRRDVFNTEYRLTDHTNSNGVRLDQDGVVDLTYDRANFNRPTIADPLNHQGFYSRFGLSNRGSYARRNDDLSEEDLNGSINLTIPAQLGEQQVDWKMGLRYRSKDKDNRPENITHAIVGTPLLTLANFIDLNQSAAIFGGSYRAGPTVNPVQAAEFFAANPNRLSVNSGSLRNNQRDTYQAEEDITGAYAMGTTDFGRLRVVGGVRWERTENSYDAFQLETGGGQTPSFTPISASTSYDNFFPSLVGTFRVRPDLLIRAAWTNTISRPDYSALAPRRQINDDNDTINEGNTGLDPLESVNLDLSLEWYLQSAGIFSAAVFHKDIENFTFTSTSDIIGGEFDGFRLTRPENGPSGSITGFEFAWTQTFRFLPKPLDGLGVQANYTVIEAEADVPGRGSVDFLPGQVDKVYNFQLFYEKAGFSARVAYNVNGRYNSAIGDDSSEDEWFDRMPTWDASVGYRLRKGWNVYVEGRNLTDTDKRRVYVGTPDRPIEQEFAGWSIVAGVKFEL